MMVLLKENVPDLSHYLGTHDHALWTKQRHDFVWDAYYKFAFVRNPWDRLVSWYAMITQQADRVRDKHELNDLWRYVLESSHSFETFLEVCTDEIDDIDGRKSFLYNQLDYVTNQEGEVIVDFIGRFENLTHDAKILFNKLGLKDISMPHHNASMRKAYQEYYNHRTQKIVAERYARDIEFFRYSF